MSEPESNAGVKAGQLATSDLLGSVDIIDLDQDEECAGCGNEKRYRGKPASSLVCCSACWQRLPKWMRHGFMQDSRRPTCGREYGATIWQNRVSVALQWMREADSLPNNEASNTGLSPAHE